MSNTFRSKEEQKSPGSFVLVYGYHAVDALLTVHPERIQKVLVVSDRENTRLTDCLKQLAIHGCPIEKVSKETLDAMTDNANHQGIVLQCKASDLEPETLLDQIIEERENPLFLVLDGVKDPHNLGACLRSADAAGVDAVIIPKDRAVGLTAAVRKVASGAAETVPLVAVTNLVRILKSLQEKGVWIYGFADEAEKSLYEMDLKGPIALVLGAEEDGLRRLTREHCDVLLQIPMYGTVSSLNVSVATGIALFEVRRQQPKL
jgi:23S rRNA (guanosine2251-2'-O)-methyltransferase